MSKLKMFIGSSKKSLRAAKLLATALEDDTLAVTLWTEGVFGLNQGYLEALLRTLTEHDFAAFILGADDMTASLEESNPAPASSERSHPSPRDNVLFESGLFLGLLGRDRTFLVRDDSVDLKIPSDLGGTELASYDGRRINGSDAAASMRMACQQITERIKASKLLYLVGEWRSKYILTINVDGAPPAVEEDVEIKASSDAIFIFV